MRLFFLALAARIRVGVRLVSCDRKTGDAVEAHRCRWDQVVGDVVCAPRRVAVLGAKASFVVGTTLILLSAKRSWLFLESMVQILVGVIAGAMIAVALYHAAEKIGIQETIMWRKGVRIRHRLTRRRVVPDGNP